MPVCFVCDKRYAIDGKVYKGHVAMCKSELENGKDQMIINTLRQVNANLVTKHEAMIQTHNTMLDGYEETCNENIRLIEKMREYLTQARDAEKKVRDMEASHKIIVKRKINEITRLSGENYELRNECATLDEENDVLHTELEEGRVVLQQYIDDKNTLIEYENVKKVFDHGEASPRDLNNFISLRRRRNVIAHPKI